jgi:AcrR family transcriptional regulator
LSNAKTGPKRQSANLGRPSYEDRPPGFSRAELVKAAEDVFVEEGYERATIRKIAARAGLTSGTIYRHFSDKADLLFAVLSQVAQHHPTFRTPREVDPVESISKTISEYASDDFYRVRRTGAEVHTAAAREPHAKALLRKYNQRSLESAVRNLGRLVADGELPEHLDAARTHQLLIIIVTGLAHLDSLYPELVGDPTWMRFIESTVSDILTRSSWQSPDDAEEGAAPT